MNKWEMVIRVAGEAQVKRDAAETALGAVFSAIGEALARGETVTIVGFGTFARKSRPAREGRNPRTGERIAIGASNSVSFRVGKALREAVN